MRKGQARAKKAMVNREAAHGLAEINDKLTHAEAAKKAADASVKELREQQKAIRATSGVKKARHGKGKQVLLAPDDSEPDTEGPGCTTSQEVLASGDTDSDLSLHAINELQTAAGPEPSMMHADSAASHSRSDLELHTFWQNLSSFTFNGVPFTSPPPTPLHSK